MRNPQRKIERALAAVLSRDPELAAEFRRPEKQGQMSAVANSLAPALDIFTDDPQALSEQVARYRAARPVLNVTRRALHVVESNAESEIWKKRLEEAGEKVLRAIDAVGRIEVKGHQDLTVAGTGFMIRDDVMATSQHVADHFSEEDDEGGFVFELNLGGKQMEAAIDFREEVENPASFEFRVLKVLHMEMDKDPDLAFLRVALESGGKPLPPRLELFTGPLDEVRFVAAIGYPKHEDRPEHEELMRRIFGNIFEKKRVSPGEFLGTENGEVVHDCSVLRGSSGSPVICLETGKVVGIHRDGEFLEGGFAVSAAVTEALLKERVLDAPDDHLRLAAVAADEAAAGKGRKASPPRDAERASRSRGGKRGSRAPRDPAPT